MVFSKGQTKDQAMSDWKSDYVKSLKPIVEGNTKTMDKNPEVIDVEYSQQLESENKPEETPVAAVPVAAPVVTTATAPPKPPAEIELVAEQPHEMEECQRSLIEWAKGKVASLQADWKELKESYELAVKNKWKSSTLKRHMEKAEAEVTYYTKMLGAFEAGYVLVPNMPGAIFSVRTDKVCPSKTWRYYYHDAANQSAKTSLPPGEGEYVARQNKVREHRIEGNKGELLRTDYQAISFGELEFPFALSRPRLMEATSRAMALRLFDEFMILPAEAAPRPGRTTVTRQDPIILGVIACRFGASREKTASFMVAWHINTRDL
jgi:hypothetical protein